MREEARTVKIYSLLTWSAVRQMIVLHKCDFYCLWLLHEWLMTHMDRALLCDIALSISIFILNTEFV